MACASGGMEGPKGKGKYDVAEGNGFVPPVDGNTALAGLAEL